VRRLLQSFEFGRIGLAEPWLYPSILSLGVAVGKKSVANPEVVTIAGGKLYLNLDKGN
jgi:hypothetical protein